MLDALKTRFMDAVPRGVDFATLRAVEATSEELTVRDDVVEPPILARDRGLMVTVAAGGGVAYAATTDTSAHGIKDALARAEAMARRYAAHALFPSSTMPRPRAHGGYRSPLQRPVEEVPLAARVDLLRALCQRLARPGDARIVERKASLWSTRQHTRFLSTDGAEIEQDEHHLLPDLGVTAHDAGETLTRSMGIRGRSRQGGFDELAATGLDALPETLTDEVLALLAAPNCPTGTMDVVLAPDQMMLQIHESIGHPLELDRILGDERNYAGTSFVSKEMFGSYQYGSPLLTVTFAPDVEGELASYAFDDEGTAAERVVLIDRGVLVRPLGSALSGARAATAGLANARASSWNRPPIDRMANLNIEPGTLSREELIASVENGVYMETNCSWSIDDARNKFQFSCELGRRIVDGELGELVKKPAYRGVSATFWRNLAGVGAPSTVEVLGTPYCGKGEPNQAIRVGHASPWCRFQNVEVFGGE